jgi:hypothetical protein
LRKPKQPAILNLFVRTIVTPSVFNSVQIQPEWWTG